MLSFAGIRPFPRLVVATSVVAAFGLVQLSLAAAPAPVHDPITDIGMLSAVTAPLIEDRGNEPEGWGRAFGTPILAPTPEPVIAAELEDDDWDEYEYFEPDYSLRGIILDADGGWALLADAGRIEIVRRGERLSGGEILLEIRSDSVLLKDPHGDYVITFSGADSIVRLHDQVRQHLAMDRLGYPASTAKGDEREPWGGG